MTEIVTELLNPAQRERLRQFSARASVDMHCHCLPGLDDGPATIEEAVDLCRTIAADGMTHVIATPHQFGRYEGCNDADTIRDAVSRLNTTLQDESIGLQVFAGADVRVDERILKSLDEDKVMTLADRGRHLLLELPHETMIDIRILIGALRRRGITPIVSHPERHAILSRRPQMLMPWLAEGAVVQVTAASLVGDFGRRAEELAWYWLSSAACRRAMVATDAHDAHRRPPRMRRAIELIADRLGHPVARRVCLENPSTVLEQEQGSGQ